MENIPYPRIYLYRQIVAAKLYIDSHFRENIDLGRIAHQACFSKFHFHRTFKSCYGKTPHAYLTSLRLKEAKVLLAKELSTQEVCHAIGFESVSSFVKLFKRAEQMTPSAYAKMIIHQKTNKQLQPLNYIPSGYAVYLGWKKA